MDANKLKNNPLLKRRNSGIIFAVLGGIIVLFYLNLLSEEAYTEKVVSCVMGLLILAMGIFLLTNSSQELLKNASRIMLILMITFKVIFIMMLLSSYLRTKWIPGIIFILPELITICWPIMAVIAVTEKENKKINNKVRLIIFLVSEAVVVILFLIYDILIVSSLAELYNVNLTFVQFLSSCIPILVQGMLCDLIVIAVSYIFITQIKNNMFVNDFCLEEKQAATLSEPLPLDTESMENSQIKVREAEAAQEAQGIQIQELKIQEMQKQELPVNDNVLTETKGGVRKMKYCSHCGKEVFEEAVICPHCGCAVGGKGAKNITGEDEPSTGLNVLSFFFPIAGLIIFLTLKDKEPNKATAAGKWALISVGVSLCFGVLSTMCIAMLAGL